MSKFIDNVNEYMNHYKIKQSVISLKTGIEKNKISRILSKKQGVLDEDMIKISDSLNKDVKYFLSDKINLNDINYNNYDNNPSIAFSMGKPTPEKEEFANVIFDFLEHIDAIMGIPKKIKKYSKGDD